MARLLLKTSSSWYSDGTVDRSGGVVVLDGVVEKGSAANIRHEV